MTKRIAILGMAATLGLSGQAAAANGAATPLIVLKGNLAPLPPITQTHDPKTDETLMEVDLEALRGGQTIVVGNQTLTAVTTGNVLNGDYTAGSVAFSDNAFSSFAGLGNIAVNTGAQVSLQSGISVVINVDD